MSAARSALAYATHLGWFVFPLRPASKEPHGRLVRHGHKDATRDPEQIRLWWSAAPDSGIGLSYRPPLSENIVLTGGFNTFMPFQGFREISTNRTLFALFANVRFRF